MSLSGACPSRISFFTPTTLASGMSRSDTKLRESMGSWNQRLGRFLFPALPDDWLTILRIGLGLQVFFYTLSLERDWNYLLGGGAGGLNARALAEGLLSTESPFVPRLGWLVALGARIGLDESTVLS